MYRQLSLSGTEVHTLRHALKLFAGQLKEQDNFDANELPSEQYLINFLLYYTLQAINAEEYKFNYPENRLINQALRYYVYQLAFDIHDAANLSAHDSQLKELYDIQQDGYNLLSKFQYYTTDSPVP